MLKVSPVKEKAIRLTKFVEYAIEHNFGPDSSVGNVAKMLSMHEDRLNSIMHGDAHMSTIDKTARLIAEMTDDLNYGYVTKGEKNMLKKQKKVKAVSIKKEVELPKKEELELPTVDMDDDLEDLETIEIDTECEATATTATVQSASADVSSSILNSQSSISISQARINQIKDNAGSAQFTPKTAKDKWADAAISLGIEDIDDHFMQTYCKEDGKIHVFKEAEGNLPYRQEIFDIQTVGLGRPRTIEYADDKVMYDVRFVVVAEGRTSIEASSEDEARAMILNIVQNSNLKVSNKPLTIIDVNSTSNPYKG